MYYLPKDHKTNCQVQYSSICHPANPFFTNQHHHCQYYFIHTRTSFLLYTLHYTFILYVPTTFHPTKCYCDNKNCQQIRALERTRRKAMSTSPKSSLIHTLTHQEYTKQPHIEDDDRSDAVSQ